MHLIVQYTTLALLIRKLRLKRLKDLSVDTDTLGHSHD